MLHVEMQEGKARMARQEHCDQRKATTATAATTAGLAKRGDLDESNLREEGEVTRVLVGGSWFASHETAEALLKELQALFVGNTKTATAKHPVAKLRQWGLAETQRGDHVARKLEGSDGRAAGWNDHHFKAFIATGGTTESGADAKRKRQNDSGTTCCK
jgi:hypothetical protein